MPSKTSVRLPSRLLASLISAALALPISTPLVFAQGSSNQPQSGASQLTQAQLAALVAPIALYPDPLVAQVLMASTYPVQVAEAYNWQRANSRLSGNSLSQALQQQTWDPSVKSLVSFPPVLGMMGSQLSWTQNLGNAVLAQQSSVMTAIQELRAKAKASGALQSNAQQTVTTQGSGSDQTIVIQPANPQVVYVPTYNPTVVYGTWPYPSYPPYTYYPPGYSAGSMLLSFGVGMAVGAALWGGCHWGGGGHWWGGSGGGNSLTINNNTYNNFNHSTNNNWSGGSRYGSTSWKPNTQNRNSNLGGVERGGYAGGESPSNQTRDAERNQLRQNLNHGGLSENHSDGGERSGGERSGSNERTEDQRSGGNERSEGSHKDPGSFGNNHHPGFGGGDHFGDGSHSGGGRSFSGGNEHFGGGKRF